jgi:hypothetical protein
VRQSYWSVELQRMPLLWHTYYMRFIAHWHKSAFLPRGGLSSYPARVSSYAGWYMTTFSKPAKMPGTS